MALTKNSRLVAARAKAQELARAAQEREAKLIDLAADYFLEIANVDAVKEDAAAKGRELIEAAKAKAKELSAKAATDSTQHLEDSEIAIGKMLDTGASKEDVAARLGLGLAVVRKVAKKRAAVHTDAGDDSVEAGA